MSVLSSSHQVQTLAYPLAADVRLGPVDQELDQIWEATLGGGPDEPVFSLNDLDWPYEGLRLVPALIIDGQTYYDLNTVNGAASLKFLSPSAGRWDLGTRAGAVALTLEVACTGQSRLNGAVYLHNTGGTSLDKAHFLLFLQAQDKKLNILEVLTQTPQGPLAALAVQRADPDPGYQLVLLDGATQTKGAAHLSRAISLGPGQKLRLRFSIALAESLDRALEAAYQTLQEEASGHWAAVQSLQKQALEVQTGQPALDAALMLSQQILWQAQIHELDQAGRPGLNAWRLQGFRVLASEWELHLALSAMAALDLPRAQALFQEWLQGQKPDGQSPQAFYGPAAQTWATSPILAQTAEVIQSYTPHTDFLAGAWPSLLKILGYWLGQSESGWPVWQFPSPYNAGRFSHTQGQLRPQLLAPDLAALILLEGQALRRLATHLPDPGPLWADLAARITKLEAHFFEDWPQVKGAWLYRDIATGKSPQGQDFGSQAGDKPWEQVLHFDPPNRLIINTDEALRGKTLKHLKAQIWGLGPQGQTQTEILTSEAFTFEGGAVTRQIWSQIDRVSLEGISRVYKYHLRSLDLSGQEIFNLLPLALEGLPEPMKQRGLESLGAFVYDSGVAVYPKNTLGRFNYAVDVAWLQLFSLALARKGDVKLNQMLLKNTLAGIQGLISQTGHFSNYYSPAQLQHSGTNGHLSGIIPLHWWLQALGCHVPSPDQVVVTGPFLLPEAVKLTWRGVKIGRSAKKFEIKFPSGTRVKVEGEGPQVIHDPSPVEVTPSKPVRPKKSPPPTQAGRLQVTSRELVWGEAD